MDEARLKVVELYSPPRVTTEMGSLPAVHLSPGGTFDLREDKLGRLWSFLKANDRAEARRRIAEAKPYVVIGSLPCMA